MYFVIGPFPPPVHGMGKNLLIFFKILSKSAGTNNVKKIDISPGTLTRGIKYHSTKIFKVLFGVLKVFLLGLYNHSKRNVVYMPVDAGLGVVYSILFTTISRLLGMELFIHHRSYAYINSYSKLMRLFVYIGGKKATHIFLCKDMEDKYRKLYKYEGKSIIVSNAGHVKPINAITAKNTKKIILGFLSNISEDKGIIETIEIYNVLKNQNYDVELQIAGPFDNNSAKKIVETSLNGQNTIKILGPVYGDDKHNFFSNIDILLFPTKYKNEAQPNVVFEAMSYFVRPITTNIGCLSSDFTSGGCDVFEEKNHNFVVVASDKIKEYAKDINYLKSQQKNSHDIVNILKLVAEKEYKIMLNLIKEGDTN